MLADRHARAAAACLVATSVSPLFEFGKCYFKKCLRLCFCLSLKKTRPNSPRVTLSLAIATRNLVRCLRNSCVGFASVCPGCCTVIHSLAGYLDCVYLKVVGTAECSEICLLSFKPPPSFSAVCTELGNLKRHDATATQLSCACGQTKFFKPEI